MGFLNDLRSTVRKQGAPVTIGIMAVLVVSSLFLWGSQGRFGEWLVFTPGWMSHPWTLLTYAFATSELTGPLGILFFIFLLFWWLWVGGSVERDLGTARYALLVGTMTVLPVLIIWAAAFVVGGSPVIAGSLLPLAGVTVAWGVRNQATPVCIWGIPANGKWIAILDTAMVLFSIGTATRNPLLGVFACAHLGLAALFASNKLPFRYGRPVYKAKPSKAQQMKESQFFEDIRRREKEREEKERLRKLFESSLGDEKEG